MDGGFRDMELLAQLLESSKQACDEQDLEGPSERDSLSDASKLTPGNIATGGSFSGPSGAPPNTQIRSTKKSSGDIWDDDEVPSQAAFTEIDDGRVKPRHAIIIVFFFLFFHKGLFLMCMDFLCLWIIFLLLIKRIIIFYLEKLMLCIKLFTRHI
eukprot:TRINITY_DN1793_c0_g1_i2.p1 TRINITY_DN1793_c0_g1~~TRINITY_DN1793_c0_g1_i2.p1  ORF type:complete len:155 (-),score=23.84 TRINITY_DN1793_c0_g1_i2:594-1058(-)